MSDYDQSRESPGIEDAGPEYRVKQVDTQRSSLARIAAWGSFFATGGLSGVVQWTFLLDLPGSEQNLDDKAKSKCFNTAACSVERSEEVFKTKNCDKHCRMFDPTALTDIEDWEVWHRGRFRYTLPSRWMPGSVNLCVLLSRYLSRPGMSALEIGCAPGKFLAYAHLKLGARIVGFDYSAPGVEVTRDIHRRLGVDSRIVQGDLFNEPLPGESFDFVYSNGLIEHFRDPLAALRAHTDLVRPGGRLLVAVPNYSGIYGWLQARFDPENLAIHNVDIMSPEALLKLADSLPLSSRQAFLVGRMNPVLVAWRKKLGRILGGGVWAGLTVLGRLQPFEIDPLRPLVVLTGIKTD